jgi:hypothetical protein
LPVIADKPFIGQNVAAVHRPQHGLSRRPFIRMGWNERIDQRDS